MRSTYKLLRSVSWRVVVVLVVLVASIVGVRMGPWSAQPYTVCPSGCPFTRIQAALDAAQDGDVITVGPGVYREHVKITKSVSLVGADPAQVRLMPPQAELIFSSGLARNPR